MVNIVLFFLCRQYTTIINLIEDEDDKIKEDGSDADLVESNNDDVTTQYPARAMSAYQINQSISQSTLYKHCILEIQ